VELGFVQTLERGGGFDGVVDDGERFLDLAAREERVGEQAQW
jgi:hypothetical protein